MDYTLSLITASITLLSICCGLLGSFMLLQKESLLADTISHCALAGISSAFLLMPGYNPWLLFLGAFATSVLSIIGIRLICTHTRHKKDTALGIVLASFFGFGLVCMTLIQKQGSAQLPLLHKFLFGNVATLLHQDLYLIGITACIVSSICILYWKQFVLISFDPSCTHMIPGISSAQLVLTTLSIITIIIGISLVGVILMSSLLIAPAAAARQWTYRTHTMVMLAIIFALSACSIGILASHYIQHLPTGPALVVVLSFSVLISLAVSRKQLS